MCSPEHVRPLSDVERVSVSIECYSKIPILLTMGWTIPWDQRHSDRVTELVYRWFHPIIRAPVSD